MMQEAGASIQRIRFTRVIRDPIHGDIRMTNDEWNLLNARELQRLRWLKQLGFTNLVYPGAEHTRLHHSIGVLHTTEKILKAIEDFGGKSLTDSERLTARCYALIHDVAHIPYGHTLEDELGFFARHDKNEPRIGRLLRAETSELGKLLNSTEYGRVALSFFDSNSPDNSYTFLKEIVEKPSGADVLDYIDRDSYFCGMDHRVDSAIYRRFQLSTDSKGILRFVSALYSENRPRPDAEFAIESVLLERFSLFLKLFTHPAKLAAGAMLGKALTHALWSEGSSSLLEEQIEQMGDAELLLELKRSADPVVAELARMLMQRQLYKPVYRVQALDEHDADAHEERREQFKEAGLFDPRKRLALEETLAKEAGVAPPNIIIYCPSSAPGLQKARQYVKEQSSGSLRMRDEVKNRSILERHRRLWTVYVFASPQLKDVPGITEVARRYFGTFGLNDGLPGESA